MTVICVELSPALAEGYLVMPSSELLVRITAAKRAVSAQVEVLIAGFGQTESHWKSDGSRITPVDIAISEAIQVAIENEFPGDQFFSEELTKADEPIPVTSRFCWVLDPIDGTNNFALGIPYCAISLALLKDGLPVYGVIYDYARRCVLEGGPGFGCLDNGKPVRVKSDAVNEQSIIGFHSPHDKKHAPDAAVLVQRFKIRGMGSSTLHLAYVAAGLFDGTVDHNVKVWDIAAAVALCLGAGVELRYLNGAVFPLRVFDLQQGHIRYVAGNASMCAELVALLAE